MKAILKISNGDKEISGEDLKNKGIYEEVLNDIQQGLKNGKTWGDYDNKINWSLYVCE